MPFPSNELLSPEHRCSVGEGHGSRGGAHQLRGLAGAQISACRDGGSVGLSSRVCASLRDGFLCAESRGCFFDMWVYGLGGVMGVGNRWRRHREMQWVKGIRRYFLLESLHQKQGASDEGK